MELQEDLLEEETFEVERVVSERICGRKRQYLLKWRGYGHQDSTWEDESNCDCKQLVQQFKDRRKTLNKLIKNNTKLQPPSKIIGTKNCNGKIMYVVQYADEPNPQTITAAEILDTNMIISFFEDQLLNNK